MNKLIIPSVEIIIEINKRLGYKVMNRGSLEFIIEKIRSKRPTKDLKRGLATASATLWYDIIAQHPFLDGNKRTATESIQYFLELNRFILNLQANGLIYISLKIANNDIAFKELVDFIYPKLEVIK